MKEVGLQEHLVPQLYDRVAEFYFSLVPFSDITWEYSTWDLVVQLTRLLTYWYKRTWVPISQVKESLKFTHLQDAP